MTLKRDISICLKCKCWLKQEEGYNNVCKFDLQISYNVAKEIVGKIMSESPDMGEDEMVELAKKRFYERMPPNQEREPSEECQFRTEHKVYEYSTNEAP